MDKIKLSCGNGGVENHQLISKFYKFFKNEILEKSEDAAVLNAKMVSCEGNSGGRLVFSTDSFTVSPIFFSGGDIGKLAICGTCNDLAMMGARPQYLTCAAIIEEGFETQKLDIILESMRVELAKNGAIVVSGDTKVVPKGTVDGIFINTSGIGEIMQEGISSNNLQDGNVIIVSQDIGRHGAAIFAAREGIELAGDLKSDCDSLFVMIEKLINENIKIVAARDATRGGLAAVLNEWAMQSQVGIEIEEEAIPVSSQVRGFCEILGFEASALANEGTFVLAVEKEDENRVLEILHIFENGVNAAKIGYVVKNISNDTNNTKIGKVILNSGWGTKRFLDMPSGELLPRIC